MKNILFVLFCATLMLAVRPLHASESEHFSARVTIVNDTFVNNQIYANIDFDRDKSNSVISNFQIQMVYDGYTFTNGDETANKRIISCSPSTDEFKQHVIKQNFKNCSVGYWFTGFSSTKIWSTAATDVETTLTLEESAGDYTVTGLKVNDGFTSQDFPNDPSVIFKAQSMDKE